MARPKKKIVDGMINRGRLQSSKEPHEVLRSDYKPGSDRSPRRHGLDVSEYGPQYKAGVRAVDKILRRKGR